MSATATRIPLAEARIAADIALALLSPACERIAIAGSIRREAPDIGDIEIVAVSRLGTPPADLFGEPVGDPPDALHDLCNRLRDEGRMVPRLNKLGQPSWGRLLKWGLFFPTAPEDGAIPIDVYACRPEQWAATLAIRTGPAEFSHRLVTPKPAGGRCPPQFQFRGWRVVRRSDGEALDTPDEEALFAVLGMSWIEPNARA